MNRSHRRTRLRLLTGVCGAVAVTLLAVAGCSSSSSSSSSSAAAAASSSPAAAASSAASSSAKVPLVVYSAQGYDSAMTKAFTKATGIPVQLDDNSTGPLLTQIEASKNNPNWGLLWVDGATAFAGLDQQGLLMKGFEPSVSWNSLGSQSVPARPAARAGRLPPVRGVRRGRTGRDAGRPGLTSGAARPARRA